MIHRCVFYDSFYPWSGSDEAGVPAAGHEGPVLIKHLATVCQQSLVVIVKTITGTN